MNAKEFIENAARNMAAIDRTLPTAQEVADAWTGQATKGAGMSEEEMLGKIAYEAYVQDHADQDPELWNWGEYSDTAKRHWIAAAKAVAEHVLQEVQTAADSEEKGGIS